MAKVGAQRAAELTGRSKSTIQRAMKSGKISCDVDANGRRVIDVAELDRAFGLLPQQDAEGERGGNVVGMEIEKAAMTLEVERLKMRIRMLEDQLDTAKENIDDIKGQRDEWQKQAQQVLITSQYSQKQAEELKAQIQERDRRARERREQLELQRRAGQQQDKSPQGENENTPPGSLQNLKGDAKGLNIGSLWRSFRGEKKEQPKTVEKKASG